MLQRRQRGQAIGLAAVAMVAMVALLAYVVDAGMFFMVRRELQNTADAAALAGAAYLYDGTLPAGTPPACITLATGTWGFSGQRATAAEVACAYARRNAPGARSLCVNDVQMDAPSFGPSGRWTYAMIVAVRCEAMYSFGRILTLHSKTISAHATAALGLKTQGQPSIPITDFLPGSSPPAVPTTRLIAD